MRQLWWVAFAGAVLTLGPCTGSAQTWPSRPVTMMVPFPAGGTADLMARECAQALSEELGQQFIVENRAGAGGNLAAAAVAKSGPDGTSILFASQSQAALNTLMFKNLPYDPVHELVPAVVVMTSPLAVFANLNAPVTTFEEMVEFAKANPGKLSIGHAGIGSMGHIASELMQQKAGIKLTGVPYRGGAPLTTDLLGGHVPLASDLLSNFTGLIKERKVRVLAVASNHRMSDAPNAPTVQELIHSPFEAAAWFAIMMPTGTSPDTVQKVNVITNRFLQSTKGKEFVTRQGVVAAGGTPADAASFIKLELEKWRPVIKAANISLN